MSHLSGGFGSDSLENKICSPGHLSALHYKAVFFVTHLTFLSDNGSFLLFEHCTLPIFLGIVWLQVKDKCA